jgi:hypothetical protein
MKLDSNERTAWFMTHHAPVGAWSSFTFGMPNRGVSVEMQQAAVEENADLLVAMSRGPGTVKAFPFVSGIQDTIQDLESSRSAVSLQEKPDVIEERWQFIPATEITRSLSATKDRYASEEICLEVFTPQEALPDPNLGLSMKRALCPGLLFHLTIDNSQHDEPAYGFIGLRYKGQGRIRPLDWSTEGKLSGIAFSGSWAMAALTKDEQVFTIRHNTIAQAVEQGHKLVHMGGQEGGISFLVPPRSTVTLPVAFGFYQAGIVTEGLQGSYAYTNEFANVEDVCSYILENAEELRTICEAADVEMEQRVTDQREYEIYSQAVRAYYASSQLITAGGKPYYNVGEGQFLWRNTMDLAVDHLPYELWRNPWVVRNIMDTFFEQYAYHDLVYFYGEGERLFPGGLSFTHDMGNYTTYSPTGYSGYEMENATFYHPMTTEELLNGIYLMSGYGLSTKDKEWMTARTHLAKELLVSMEARDHYDPAQRNGILKARTSRSGLYGKEITTYDSLDHALASARGNLYIAVKTLCAAWLLHAFFKELGESQAANQAMEMADKTAQSLMDFYDEEKSSFRANLYEDVESRLLAAVEPFAVLQFMGIEPLATYPQLAEAFQKHIATCMTPGICLDERTGGLKLSSSSDITWTSKVILSQVSLQHVFGIDLNDFPSVRQEVVYWCQEAAAQRTIADQILCSKREAIGGFYYPRPITSFLWMFPTSQHLS